MPRLVALLLGSILVTFFVGVPVRAADLEQARQLLRSGDYADAGAIAAEAIEAGTWNQRWPRLLIEAQLIQGLYAEALATYEQAMERFASSLPLRMQGIEVLRYNGLADRALAERAQIFEMLRMSPARYSGTENAVAAGRYFAARGEDGRKILELFYDRAVAVDPNYVDAHVAIAELALAKNDFDVAARSLETAKRLDPDSAEIALLAARAWQPSDPKRATAELQRALQLNPRHIPSLLMQADELFDREFYAETEQTLDAVAEINPHHPIMWAYRSILATVRGKPDQATAARENALQHWPRNPEVDYVIGRKLSHKYRFAEGAEAQRRALQADPTFTEARFALAQDLLRLGEDELGWELAEWAQQDDAYNVVAFNLMNLRDRLSNFEVLRRGNFLVRMERREAAIYGTEVLDLLEQAEAELCEKYQITVDAPIVVEIFPDQQDFAIRTFGLPGGDGFLGVCFGRVITANSPASQGEDPSNWKAVLWHEFCHVVTLSKTNNRMPRWLSEGISVYEERLRDPTWGQRMTATFRQMILGDDLVPISRLSGAFLSPKTPMHLQLAYFQASLAVEFLIDRYGVETLRRILDDLGAGIPINEVLQRYSESLDNLDAEFVEFARGRAEAYGAGFTWTPDDVPESKDPDELRAWLEQHPDHYVGMRALIAALVEDGQFDQATEVLNRMRDIFADDAADPGLLLELAAIERRQQRDQAERELLEALIAVSADRFPERVRLMELQAADMDWSALAQTAAGSLEVNPLLSVGHQRLVEAADQLDKPELAVRSLEAMAEMDPVDPAGLWYQTALARRALGDTAAAKRMTLKALEEAPHYREAQALLLQLVNPPPTDPQPAEEQSEPGDEEPVSEISPH
jgi:tetratricopeptide (TPR) repeat protein